MNMWAGYPDFLDFLAEDFKNFLENVEEVDLKSKYLLPNIVDRLLKEERVNVRVLETQEFEGWLQDREKEFDCCM